VIYFGESCSVVSEIRVRNVRKSQEDLRRPWTCLASNTWNRLDHTLTASPSSGYRKAAEEESDPATHGKGIRSKECGSQVQLERDDDGGSKRQKWTKTSGPWLMFHQERQ